MTEAEFEKRFEFKVSYDLESEYKDTVTGRHYRVRYGCHHGNTKDSYLPTVKALIGTVCNEGYGDRSVHEFPPADVVEAFREMSGLPFVGVRFTEDWQAEYSNGRKPHTTAVWGGTTTMLTAWAGYCKQQWYGPNPCDHHLF